MIIYIFQIFCRDGGEGAGDGNQLLYFIRISTIIWPKREIFMGEWLKHWTVTSQ